MIFTLDLIFFGGALRFSVRYMSYSVQETKAYEDIELKVDANSSSLYRRFLYFYYPHRFNITCDCVFMFFSLIFLFLATLHQWVWSLIFFFFYLIAQLVCLYFSDRVILYNAILYIDGFRYHPLNDFAGKEMGKTCGAYTHAYIYIDLRHCPNDQQKKKK